ncbi:MAG: bifunctional diguanylate cyclase/phosphodiesterase [Gammaproteobacteria bacterium]|nr:bifunctional diguanylate cyclase/phosphodiesterase [Gammaproteobacteria bacterium]
MSDQLSHHYEQQLAYLSLHDSLTDLPNRSFFIESLHQWLEQLNQQKQRQQIAVVTLDVDRFKVYNESLGSTGGDSLLQALAKRLKLIARNDDIVARFGSDEFALLIAMNQTDRIEVIAQRYYRLLNEPFLVGDQSLFIALSTGIAIAPQDGQDVQTLLNRANQARIQAKQAGGNQFQFYRSSMTQAVHKRLALEQDLRNAIGQHQLKVLYQAKINAQTGQLAGAEALIVWQHPLLGQLNPEVFIPIAEETGLIIEIGAWVMFEACRQACLWRQNHPNFHISINLSARQFLSDQLIDQVKRAVGICHFPADALDLEITESLAMVDIEHTTQTLNQLKALGVQLSLDDFGTGYSSFAYLRAFPVDTLKIDRSFIMRIGTENAIPADEKIVTAIIAMAKSLGLSVVAEGVENAYQMEFLRQHACNLLQGYYCGRPLSAHDFEQLALQRYNVNLASE